MLLKSERLSFHRIMINFLTVDNFFTQLHSCQKLSIITTTIMFSSESDAGSLARTTSIVRDCAITIRRGGGGGG